MKKRPCPWSDDGHGRTMKNHVSDKDAEMTDTHAMANVYSKTLQKLFGGANSHSKQNNNDKIQTTSEAQKTNNCVSCVRQQSISFGSGICSSCSGLTCSLCISKCQGCLAMICGNCSMETTPGGDSNGRVCLGCRDSLCVM